MRRNIFENNKGPASRRQANASRGGYTLVEVLVAVSIFTVSILGLLVTLSQGIADTGYAKKKMTAAYLAQEGIEYIRNMRDTSMVYALSGEPVDGWPAFLSYIGPCLNAGGCDFNPAELVFTELDRPMLAMNIRGCGAEDCRELFYDAVTGSYGYVVGQPSGLTRKISVAIVSVDEIKVTSTVSWTQGSGKHSIEFSDNLYKWIE